MAELLKNTEMSRSKELQTGSLVARIKNHLFLYILLFPALALTLFFSYIPLPGIIIAFKDYDMFAGILGSDWVGLANFNRIFEIPMFISAILNTLLLSTLALIINFPAPIIFALLLNEMKKGFMKRAVQTISYLPHFLSMISVIGIVYAFYAKYGPFNDLLVYLFGEKTERVLWLANQSFFIPNVLIIEVWKGLGWGSIIYLAALTAIDPQLYESAYIDGAGKWRQMIHVTLPGIMPTAIMLLILRMGNIFHDNFQLIYGLQNAAIKFEVISTIVYKYGITGGDFSLATAFGFSQGLVAFILIYVTNKIAGRITNISIW